MPRFFRSKKESLHSPPGSSIFVGQRKMDTPRIHRFDYDRDNLAEEDYQGAPESFPDKDKNMCSWVNIDGLHNSLIIGTLAEKMSFHHLMTEDILNTSQRPKYEEFPDQLFLVLKMFKFNKNENLFEAEQLSMVLQNNRLISFQEVPGDVFDPVRERIRQKQGKIRTKGADYLFFSLADGVVDSYYQNLSWLAEKIEMLEEEIGENPSSEELTRINHLRRELHFFRKSVKPAQEALFQLSRSKHGLLTSDTQPYLRDLYDHICQILEALDSYRELLRDQQDLCNSLINNRLNNIMKTLTLLSAVFIPITFIAGVYGTNFENFPDLHYRYSYYIFLGVEALIAGVLLWVFKRKKWF